MACMPSRVTLSTNYTPIDRYTFRIKSLKWLRHVDVSIKTCTFFVQNYIQVIDNSLHLSSKWELTIGLIGTYPRVTEIWSSQQSPLPDYLKLLQQNWQSWERRNFSQPPLPKKQFPMPLDITRENFLVTDNGWFGYQFFYTNQQWSIMDEYLHVIRSYRLNISSFWAVPSW